MGIIKVGISQSGFIMRLTGDLGWSAAVCVALHDGAS